MKNIKKQLQYVCLAIVAMFTVGLATPLTPSAGAVCDGPNSRVLTFPMWQNGLPGSCSEPKINRLTDFWIIVLNGVEILLQVVAYVSVGFIIWGGFKYIKSQGDPGKISEAKMAIINAVIGLVIAFASVIIVEYIQGRFVQS